MRLRCVFTQLLSKATEKGQEYDATASCKQGLVLKTLAWMLLY